MGSWCEQFELGFEFGNAGFERSDGALDFGGREAWRDELGAVPIIRQNVDDKDALDLRCVGDMVSLEDLETAHIKAIVARTPNLAAAADVLGIDPVTLYRKRKKLGLHD